MGMFFGCKLLVLGFYRTPLHPHLYFSQSQSAFSSSCKMYVHISKILPIVLQRVLARRDASCWLFTPSTALPSTPYSCSYLPVYLIVKKCVILRSWKMCFSDIANCMHRVFASCWLFTVASLLPPSPSAPTRPYWETPLCVLLPSQHPPFILPPVLTP